MSSSRISTATLGNFIAPIQLETGTGAISSRRLQLLAAIAKTGSIAQAAKEIGITYKAAWDATEAINNLAGQKVIQSQHGGRGGGGATLTAAGDQLLSHYIQLEQLQQAFMAQIQQKSDLTDSLNLLRRISMKTSARNILMGKVSQIKTGAVNSEVSISLPGGDILCAVITCDSVTELGLQQDKPVYALIKASWIILAEPTASLRTSARNCLQGEIIRLTPGAVNAEVTLQLQGGSTLSAIITQQSFTDLAWQVGDNVNALIKASHIILATDD